MTHAPSSFAPPTPPRALWPRFAALSLSCLAALLAAVLWGATSLSLGEVWAALWGRGAPAVANVVTGIRLPRALTAALAGAGLGVAGLQMQTLLRNPLADPFILGVTSGASLGVALVVLATGGAFAGGVLAHMGLDQGLSLVVAASLGAAVALVPSLILSLRGVPTATLLIVGVMIGYGAAALVTVLVAGSSAQELQHWVAWTLGSFAGVSGADLPVLAGVVAFGGALAGLNVKALNALAFGENDARSMGVHTGAARALSLISASVLAGAVTAYCGPIGFLGLAAPHLARGALGMADHRVLLPAVALLGAICALVAQILAQAPWGAGALPINAVTALIGVPVVLYILWRDGRARGRA